MHNHNRPSGYLLSCFTILLYMDANLSGEVNLVFAVVLQFRSCVVTASFTLCALRTWSEYHYVSREYLA
jgi:hypothetical protein